jgi:hypothetical protein
MKNVVVLVGVLLVTATAYAEPALTASVPAEPALAAPGLVPVVPQAAAQPTTYVAAGAAFGGDRGGVYLNPTLDIGYRIDRGLWAHAKLVGGGNFGLDESTTAGSRFAASAGIEARPCVLDGALCGIAGIDLGVRHSYLDAEYDHYNSTDGILVEHVGLDVGTKHVRVRPTLEVDESNVRAFDGIALGAGIAYVW